MQTDAPRFLNMKHVQHSRHAEPWRLLANEQRGHECNCALKTACAKA